MVSVNQDFSSDGGETDGIGDDPRPNDVAQGGDFKRRHPSDYCGRKNSVKVGVPSEAYQESDRCYLNRYRVPEVDEAIAGGLVTGVYGAGEADG